jgi:hypothetical protein
MYVDKTDHTAGVATRKSPFCKKLVKIAENSDHMQHWPLFGEKNACCVLRVAEQGD